MKEIEFTINEDGTIEVDQIGYKGKQCVGDINSILKALGREKKTVRKQEYYDGNAVRISQRRM